MRKKTIVGERAGRIIRFHRELKDMSREKLAEQSILSAGYISQVERGERTPSLETIYKIAVGLDMDAMVLLEEITDETFPTIEEFVKKNRPEYN